LKRTDSTETSRVDGIYPAVSSGKITIPTYANPIHPYYKVAFAVAQEWKKFGIDVVVQTTELFPSISGRGEFDAIATSTCFSALGWSS